MYNTRDLSIAAFFIQYFKRNDLPGALPLIRSNKLLKAQFEYLSLNAYKPLINKGLYSSSTILRFILETKLVLQSKDKDLEVMLHEIDYSVNEHLSLVIKGENQLHTAMAKAVGLPLGIAAKLILERKIKETGLHIPIIHSIYEPVLNELKLLGVKFKE